MRTEMLRPYRRTLARLAIVSILLVGLFLVVMEVLARLVVASPERTYVGEMQSFLSVLAPGLGDSVEYDPDLFWKLKPGLKDFNVAYAVGSRQADFAFSTNEFGLRSPSVPPMKTGTRILAIGSFGTFGFGVGDADTWPAQLATLLNEGNSATPFEVVNAGLFGYSSLQGLRYLQRDGVKLLPDIVVVSFWHSDTQHWSLMPDKDETSRLLVQGVERALMYSRLYTLIALRMRDKGKPVKPPPEPPEPPEKVAAKQKIVDEHVSRLTPEQAAAYIVHEAKKQQAANTLREIELPVPLHMHSRLTPDELEGNLIAMSEICRSNTVKMILLIWPPRAQAETAEELSEYQKRIEKVGAVANVPVVNLVPAFQAVGGDLFVDDIHANAAGCRLVAESVAKTIAGLANSEGREPAEP